MPEDDPWRDVVVGYKGGPLSRFRWLEDRFIAWETHWNHPYDREWPGYPDTHWSPRFSWFCTLADWLTGGRCHD